MLTRYKWYSISLPEKASRMTDLLLRSKVADGWFTEAPSVGGRDVTRYYWRTEISITRIDHRGNAISEIVDAVNFADFSLVDAGRRSLLRIINPPRNLRMLLNAFESVVGRGFACEVVSFKKFSPASILSNVDEARLVGMKLINVLAAKGVLARMEFASKQGIVENDLNMLRGLVYEKDQVVYELLYKGVRGQFAYSANGSVRLGGALQERLLTILERDVVKMVREAR